MKTLKGQDLQKSDYADMQRQLEAVFYDIIFRPIVDLLAPRNAQVKKAARELKNAVTAPVVAGVRSGKIQYSEDTFSGDFSAAISKALRSYGARYSKQQKTYTILQQDLPPEVLAAVVEYAAAAKDLHYELVRKLDEVQRGLEQAVRVNKVNATVTVSKMERKFNQDYGEAIGREELSERSSEALSRGYSDNMELWVKNFSADTIRELREAVEENAAAGYRFDHLVDRIQGRYDVSRTKAEFLARQETSLLVSKHREQRFGEVGITEYVWRTAGDVEVREGHRELNGRTFEFAKPPVVDAASGRRANPGEDYRCRCRAEPVMPRVLTDA